jgi:alginate O-acetyltransferase complex protein AlgI
MIFNTWVYGLFLAVAVGTYWLVPQRWRPGLLTAYGVYFYWFYYPPQLYVVLVMTFAVFGVAFLVQPGARGRRLAFTLGVGACVGLLGYYKYQWLLRENLQEALGWLGVQVRLDAPHMHAPLGISFFTFEFVHYLVEVYRGTFAPGSLPRFGLFVMFFPTLICGPIKRFQLFDPQEHTRRRLEPTDVHAGLERILFGFAKKSLVADQLAPYTTSVLTHPGLYGSGQLWLAVYGYAVQIYLDFSGYSDIAIGSARLFGYSVPENFDWPYLQPNIARFWRSWHMSLTSWITDYVYIPLGGSRRGELRGYWNRLVSMTLCGLWHGAAIHFAAWGLYHGLALNVFRLWERVRGRARPTGPTARTLATLVTFHVVCIGWVFFVCDVGQAWVVIGRLLMLPV